MTITATSLVRRSLRLIGALDASESPTAEDMTDAIDTLQALFAELRGSDIMIPDYAVDGPDDELSIDLADREAIAAQLALRLAPEYGLSLSAEAAAAARESWTRFMHRYFQAGKTDFSELPIAAGRCR
ncbi:packaged DNA stabilization gp4 family protein [Pseudoxanthomonas sp.]|uniref:packaged DNA stabilization gp4 family protein n=1 Tax=Pseudoxanthomonas sp. TaxID=1871049 RepID=UPI002625680B|nr:packaged DNA stabilization gp4 family protein [Pseudoxanthomonas sp.]WDS36237.1 MAG: packaged DNA stabilization gp4 family protein [Pseudoxanthomonas sp.]